MEQRYDEQAQQEILERARQLHAQPQRATIEDLERMGEELGIPKAHVWQAMSEYEATLGGRRKKVKKINGQIEWAAFAIMAIHFVFQTFMVYRWTRGLGYLLPFEDSRWFLFVPFAALLGLLAMGSPGKFKLTVAYLVGSMGAGFIFSLFLRSVQGYGLPMSYIPKIMLSVLVMEIAIVAALSVPGFLSDPKRALKQLFGSPTA